jgi:hypothetical protein
MRKALHLQNCRKTVGASWPYALFNLINVDFAGHGPVQWDGHIGYEDTIEVLTAQDRVRMINLTRADKFSGGQIEHQNLLSFFPGNEQSIAGQVDPKMIEAAFYRSWHVILGSQLQWSCILRGNRLPA